MLQSSSHDQPICRIAILVRAASILLNKVLPDCKSVTMTAEVINKPVRKMSDGELQEIIRAGLERERAERLAEGAPLKAVSGRSNNPV